MMDLRWLSISQCPLLETVSSAQLYKGKETPHALLSLSPPLAPFAPSGVCWPRCICLSPNWTSQHVHLSPLCPLTGCQPLSDIQWNIRGNEFCVSVLSGSFAIQAGWWAWCSHRKSADQAGRGFLFPGIVATGMLSRSQVACSWVVRGTGLSEMSCSQQARHDRRGSWSPGHSLQESH